jgi:hypothetical protein
MMDIVRVDTLEPSELLFLLEAAAAELEPRLVEEVAPATDARSPDQHRRRVGHHTEVALALAQGEFGPATTHVLHHQADDEAGLHGNKGRRPNDVALVLIPDRELAKPDDAASREVVLVDAEAAELVQATGGADFMFTRWLGMRGNYSYQRMSVGVDKDNFGGDVRYSFGGPQIYAVFEF